MIDKYVCDGLEVCPGGPVSLTVDGWIDHFFILFHYFLKKEKFTLINILLI